MGDPAGERRPGQNQLARSGARSAGRPQREFVVRVVALKPQCVLEHSKVRIVAQQSPGLGWEACGTKELIIPSGYGGGMLPELSIQDFTAFNKKALFAAEDAFGNIDLWTTDGTAAGTKELEAEGA
jgi:hypothetical protein